MHLQRSSQDPDTENCKKYLERFQERCLGEKTCVKSEIGNHGFRQEQTMFDFIFLPSSFNWIVIFLRLMDVPVSLSSETPDISWYKDNVQIVATGDLFQYMNYNRTLRLGSLRSSSHNGIYKCVAGISGAILQKTTTLKVIGLYFFRRIF